VEQKNYIEVTIFSAKNIKIQIFETKYKIAKKKLKSESKIKNFSVPLRFDFFIQIMIKYFKILAITAILGVFGCDKIPENKRLSGVNLDDLKKVAVLLDFTGWSCTNCPQAAQEAHRLQGFFPQNLIVVSLHPYGSHWTEPSGDALDLRSEAATAYFDFFGKEDKFPVGTIDMAKYEGKLLIDKEKWIGATAKRVVLETGVNLEMTCSLDERKVIIEAKINSETNENLSLILWLTESKIYGKQLNNGIMDENYEHNHVLRAAINGVWGENFSENYTKEYIINQNWNIDNCSIIGVIINAEKEIVAAIECKM